MAALMCSEVFSSNGSTKGYLIFGKIIQMATQRNLKM